MKNRCESERDGLDEQLGLTEAVADPYQSTFLYKQLQVVMEREMDCSFLYS